MAWMNQERKKELAPSIKKVLKKYGVKGTIAVNNHSTLVVNIKSGALDLVGEHNRRCEEDAKREGRESYFRPDNYIQVNTYHVSRWVKDPTIKAFYEELIAAMKGNIWFDKSDVMTDYFHTAYYIDINVGSWKKPYVFTGEAKAA